MDEKIKNWQETFVDEVTNQPFKIWEDATGCPIRIWADEWDYIEKCIKKMNNINFLYLTLSPDKFKRNIPVNDLDKLKEWCEKWFNDKNPFYHGGVYVIEWGSDKEPHYHVHCLLHMKCSNKHALKLKNFWKKYFPESELKTSLNLCGQSNKRGEYCYASITSREILQDKLDYFTNSNKGFHENYVEIMQPEWFGIKLVD